MTNWAHWRGGSLVGTAVCRAYELEARGLRSETSIPLLNGDALEVDEAVHQLEPDLRRAVEERWLRSGPIVEMARRLGCALVTVYRRLERAHEKIHTFRRALRERSQRNFHSYYENRKRT